MIDRPMKDPLALLDELEWLKFSVRAHWKTRIQECDQLLAKSSAPRARTGGGESERGADARNVSVERRRLAATSAAANPLASDKCAEKVAMEPERQRPEPKRTGCGAVDGSTSGCWRVDEMEGATWMRAYPVNAGTHYI